MGSLNPTLIDAFADPLSLEEKGGPSCFSHEVASARKLLDDESAKELVQTIMNFLRNAKTTETDAVHVHRGRCACHGASLKDLHKALETAPFFVSNVVQRHPIKLETHDRDPTTLETELEEKKTAVASKSETISMRLLSSPSSSSSHRP
jgi:hypothetical protein